MTLLKRPLAGPSVLFIGGILLAEVSGALFAVFAFATLLFVLAAILWRPQRELLLAVSVVAAGAAALALETREVGPDDLRKVIGREPRIATVTGRLVEAPYERSYDDRTRFLTQLECHQVQFRGSAPQRMTGTIAVLTTGAHLQGLWHGQIAEVTGVIHEPESVLAPGLFDYRAYLRRLGIYYMLRASSPGEWRILGSPNPPVAVRFNTWAKATLARGLPREDEALRLLWAMTLGWRTALNGEVSQPFMRSGTLHVFAISGLHIMMIAAIIVGVLRALRTPRRACGLIVIPAVWFYTYATGWQASAVRSAVMATVFFGSWVLIRPPDLFNSLAAAALIILIADPQQLFQAGFQLSFAVVFCLALFGNFLRPWQNRIASGDPLLPFELRPWWQQKALRALSFGTGLVITSFAAWLGSIPLIAYYFHLLTPVSVISNVLVVPMSGLALASNLGSLLFGSWFPLAAEILNHSAWFWMNGMLWVSEWTARWPGAALNVGPPGPFAICLYYAVLVAIAARMFANRRWRLWVGTGIALLAMATALETAAKYTRYSVTVLPMDAGHAVFADAPSTRRDVLIDCGDVEGAQITVKPFLQSRGVRQLSNLVLTHGDAGHVGGLDTVTELFNPQKVAIPAVRYRSPVYRDGLRRLEASGHQGSTELAPPKRVGGSTELAPPRRIVRLLPGSRVGDWTILYPRAEDQFANADDMALVMRGDIRGMRLLLLPDLGAEGQKQLLDQGLDVRSDVVIASNPRSGEPVSDLLLDRIQPRLIVIADSKYVPEARTREPFRQRLAARGVPVLYLSEAGAVTLVCSRDGVTAIPTRLSATAQRVVVRRVDSEF